MGVRMAQRLACAGHEMYVYNRTAEKARQVIDAGAKSVSSPAEIARCCDIVFTSVTNDEALLQVLEGENGLFSGAKEGQILVEMSTTAPKFSELLRGKAYEHGLLYLDAPVIGSMYMIEQGLLKILASGDKAAYEAALPFFGAIGRTSTYLGEGTQARFMKLAVNMVICSYLTIYSELLLAGEGMGFGWEELNDALENSLGSSPMLKDKGTTHKERVWSGTTALTSTAMKDLGLALDCAGEMGCHMPLTAIVCQYDAFMYHSSKYGAYSTFGTIGMLEELQGIDPDSVPGAAAADKPALARALELALVGATEILFEEAVRFCAAAGIEKEIALSFLTTCHGATEYRRNICTGKSEVISPREIHAGLSTVLKRTKEKGLFLPVLALSGQIFPC